MSTTDCEILVSQLRASWIEWLYIEDESKRKKLEHDITVLEYRIATNCTDVSENLKRVHDELKRLPTPDWLKPS